VEQVGLETEAHVARAVAAIDLAREAVARALEAVGGPAEPRLDRVADAVAQQRIAEAHVVALLGGGPVVRPVADSDLELEMAPVDGARGRVEPGPIGAEVAQLGRGCGEREQDGDREVEELHAFGGIRGGGCRCGRAARRPS
jgi:hypothetical protein